MTQHPLLRQLPGALRAQMEREGLSQSALSKRVSIPQWEISRALNSKRKRLTDPMRVLCRYAGLMDAEEAANEQQDRLNALMRELVGESPRAARVVENMLLTLAPVLSELGAKKG